jgi:glutamate/tyrosine decarboxylase-like PLP-dependent enzyme
MTRTPVNAASDETLDPEDWNAFRALAHRMVDDICAQLATLDERPAWEPMPGDTRARLSTEQLPQVPQGAESAYADFARDVMPYTNGNRHARFWGWVQGNGTPLGMMADMLASGINPNAAGLDQAPKLVELQTIKWLAELMGYPTDASGIMVSGGSMANVLGLAVARYAKAGFDIRKEGMQGGPRLIVYTSSEVHSWAQKAVELFGMGSASLRKVRVDAELRLDLDALRAAIKEDRAAGHRPICVIGTAGTVQSAAIDDMNGIADICEQEALWFHCDGAFGALARLSPALAPRVAGMERADSLAFDLHKWMYLPYEIACVLVKDAQLHRDTFALTPSYLRDEGRGVIAGGIPFADRGPELSRSFKALKVWMSLKAEGAEKFGRLIEQNVQQSVAFADRIRQVPHVQVVAPVSLNIVCFRAAPPGMSLEGQDALNKELLLRLQEEGVAIPSGSQLHGRYIIRVANTNHRSKWSDFEALAVGVERILATLIAAG